MSQNNLNQNELIARIKELEIEVKQLKSRKKYGLVWEDKPEDVVLQCEKQIPVLKEIKNRKIVTDNTSPTNLLIEGDNYHALSVLNYTHKGKIDVIYIDPPYNTGNKDFIYNDNYVDREDSFRHSKWLSFMEKRLRLAKELLKDSGVIFISIDDNEQAQLKLLCDSVFGENRHINTLVWEKKIRASNKNKNGFSKVTEYIFFYKNSEENFLIKDDPQDQEYVDSVYKNPDNDYRGIWRTKPLWSESNSNKRKILVLPDGRKIEAKWFISQEKLNLLYEEDRIYESSKGTLNEKLFLNDGKNPLNFMPAELVGTTELATKSLKELFVTEKNIFTNPKPVNLIKYLIEKTCSKDSIILDFMAGSGTTGHAVMKLNKEDGGNRQYILCTNNENNICEEVTYERLKRVIKGYTNKKGENIEGLGGNLEYLKCEYIDKTRHSDNMKMRLMRACSEMLCLKENTFNLEKEVKDGDTLMYRIYSGVKVISQGSDSTTVKHYMGVYYDLDDSYLEDMRSELKHYEDAHKTAYIFSLRSVSDFIDDYRKWKGISIEEVPEKILEIYETIYKRNIRR